MAKYNRKRLTTISILILVILGIFYGTVYVLGKYYLNTKNVKDVLVKQAQTKLQRKISVDDKIGFNISWDMTPHIVLHNLTISNANWAQQPNMFKVKELDLNFSLGELIFKRLHILTLKITGADIYLESRGNKKNWEFPKEGSNNPSEVKLAINSIMINDSKLSYNNAKLLIDEFELSMQDDNTEFITHFEGKLNDIPLRLGAEIINNDKEIRFKLKDLQANNTDIEGNLLITKEPLKISGEFEADKLSLQDFNFSTTGDSSGEYTIPNTPLPISKLKGSNVDFQIKIKTLLLHQIAINNFNLQFANQDDVISAILKPAAKIANGKLNFKANYDLNKATPLFVLDINTVGLNFADLMQAITGKTPLKGSSLDFKTNLSGQGDNLNSIVGSMQGKILATIGPGEFLNSRAASVGTAVSNILSSMISFDKTKPSTGFNCGVVNLNVNGGVAIANNGIGVETASVNATGSGTIDLRNGHLNLTITPQNLLGSGINLGNFSMAQVVTVTGTISNPQIGVNPMALLNSGASLVSKISGGMAVGGLPAGIASMLGGSIMPKSQNQNTVSPCKRALGE